jgi:hypothetical protein
MATVKLWVKLEETEVRIVQARVLGTRFFVSKVRAEVWGPEVRAFARQGVWSGRSRGQAER